MIVWVLTSLFLAPEDCPAQEDKEATIAQELPEDSKPPPSDLVLQGILSLPDTQHWIVWINGVRIDSRRPQSIMGWRVVSVHEDHVVITSANGGQKELWLQQDPDQDDMIPPAATTEATTEAPTEIESPQDTVLEADNPLNHEQVHDAPHEESKEVSQEFSQGTRSKDQRRGNKEGREERHGGSRENIVSATHKDSTDPGHIPTQQPSDAPKERSLFSPSSPPSSPPVKEEAPFVPSPPPSPSAQFSRQP